MQQSLDLSDPMVQVSNAGIPLFLLFLLNKLVPTQKQASEVSNCITCAADLR